MILKKHLVVGRCWVFGWKLFFFPTGQVNMKVCLSSNPYWVLFFLYTSYTWYVIDVNEGTPFDRLCIVLDDSFHVYKVTKKWTQWQWGLLESYCFSFTFPMFAFSKSQSFRHFMMNNRALVKWMWCLLVRCEMSAENWYLSWLCWRTVCIFFYKENSVLLF